MNRLLNYLRKLHGKYGDVVGFIVSFFFLITLLVIVISTISLFAFIMYINLDVANFLVVVAIFYILTKDEK